MGGKCVWLRIKNHPDGHKYRLALDYRFSVPPITPVNIHCGGVTVLAASRIVLVHRGFTWDGASGPTFDDSTNMRASLAHDALYYLLREGLLGDHGSKEWAKNRKIADQIFYKMLREDGMHWFRAKYYYLGVRLFGGKHAKG